MRRIVFVSIGLLLLTGCGPAGHGKGVVKGTITYKGQPVNGATLQFYPASGGDLYLATVTAGQDGAFRSSDVPPGDYKIVVQGATGTNGLPSSPPKDPKMQAQYDKMKGTPTIQFPDKYKDPKTTDLKCTIKAGDQTLPPLQLSD